MRTNWRIMRNRGLAGILTDATRAVQSEPQALAIVFTDASLSTSTGHYGSAVVKE